MTQRVLSWRQIVAVVLLAAPVPMGYVLTTVPQAAFIGWTMIGVGVGAAALLFILEWQISKDLLPDVLWALDRDHVDQIGDAHVILVGKQTRTWATLCVLVQNTRLGPGVFELCVGGEGRDTSGGPAPLYLQLEPAQVVLCVMNLRVQPVRGELHVELVLGARCRAEGLLVRRKRWDPIWEARISIRVSRREGKWEDPVDAGTWMVCPLWTIKERNSTMEIRRIVAEALRDAGKVGAEVTEGESAPMLWYRRGK